MYDASNRKDIRRAEKAARLDARQDAEVIANLMSTVAGRSWMLRRLEACHIFATSVNRDPILMGYAEGERNIGLQLLNDIMSACPDSYIQMMREGEQRDAARDPNNRATDDPDDSDNGVAGSVESEYEPADRAG